MTDRTGSARLQEVLELATEGVGFRGGVIEVGHRWDEQHQDWFISFTTFDIMTSETITSKQFELPLEQAYWYFAGVMNGMTWLFNLTASESGTEERPVRQGATRNKRRGRR